ncbi:centrosomal protein of 126 kDa [Protobothrops mucrosquamatus]|uniref:centrosomal protein of 126 kDa n=1 Tax=Protobothrops mucrosquamatus TaxID=103944 RepID=UPI0010FB09BC|nr:centrosomal protein of 126 kDa [Protobothrops mucrosquamatus]
MELGGGGGGGGGYYPSSWRPATAVAAERSSPALGRASAEVAAAAGAAGGDLSATAPCWRKGLSESAPPRGLGRRSLNAFVPCTNLKVLLERDLSKERHELLKDQRLFRNRARKHSIETNKRRRALEEKWKENEEKEQKFREQILLQRKLKHQEATEKFQRSHISSSQHKKGGVQRKPENKLDEAQKCQVPGLSSRVIGSSIGINSSVTRNGPFQWKQNLAKAIYDRTLQVKNRINPCNGQLLLQKNLDEKQHQLQQHSGNSQGFHQEVNEITRSGSVCSVDSLEAKEQNGSCTAPCKISSLSTQEASSIQHPEGSKSKSRRFSAEHDDSFSTNQHVNNWLINLKTSDIQATSPFRDILIKYNVVPSDEVRCNPDLKSLVPTSSEQRESETGASDGNLPSVQNKTEDKSVLLKCPSSNIISTGDPLPADSPAAKLNKAWPVPNPAPAVAEQENFELSESNRTSSTETFIPNVDLSNQQWNVTSYFSNSFLLNCMQKGKDIHAARCTEDTDYAAEVKGEKYSDHVNVEASTFEEPSRGSTDQHKDNEEGKEAEIILPVPQGEVATNLSDPEQQKNDNICERKVTKLPKSILKKESKYELGCFKAMVVNRGIKFGHQPVASVRDSVELAKIKGKDGEAQRNCKKLRWFDEINRVVEINNNDKNSESCVSDISQAQSQAPGFQLKTTASKTNLRSIPSCLLNSVFPENNLENSQISAKLATVGNSERDNPVHNILVPKGYHIAKQAWMASRSEEMIPFIYSCDPKNPKTNPRKGRMKMIKRPKSAKVPSSTIIAKNRKSAVIRPQSASEATKIVRASGKIIIPHPPCKPIQSKKPDENPTNALCQSSNLCKPSTDVEYNQSDKNLLPECQTLGRVYTDDPSTSGSSCHSQITMIRPSYSIYTYEPLTKSKCIMNSIPPVVHYSNISRRSPMFSENGLCPDRIPTDEEITILWQGVHRALVQRDGAAGDSQHYASLCNNSNNGDLQHARSNVSHITIDGGHLMSNMKSGVRVNPILSSQPSAHFAFARRKQINENNENKRKALLEQRRQMSASSARKPTGAGQNISQAPIQVHSQCMFEPVRVTGGINHSDEDGTTQFLIPENLVNLSAAEGEILAGLDTPQPYRQIAVRNRPPRQGMSSLSFEEHKVLQSLDRINHRLQNVHETINKNPSSTSVLQTISPLVTSPSYMDIMPHKQRYRSILDATHSLKQRRY